MTVLLEATPERVRLITALEQAMIREPENLRDKAYLSTRSGPVVASYLAWKKNSVQPETLDTYEHTLARLVSAWKDQTIGEFTAEQIQIVIESWPQKSRRTKAQAPIRDFFRFAVAWERLPYNPCDLLPTLRPPTEQKVYDIFTYPEQQRIMTAAGRSLLPARDRAVAWLLLDTGARRNDVRMLKWKDVNLEDLYVQYMHRKGGKESIAEYGHECWDALLQAWSTPYPRPPKGETETRTPRADDHVLYPNGASGGIYQVGRWVTWLDPSVPMAYSTIFRWWKRTLEEAEVPHRKLHMTRHTHGTELYEATGDTKVVKDKLGHSSEAMAQRYIHNSRRRPRAGMDAVEALRKAYSEQQTIRSQDAGGDQ